MSEANRDDEDTVPIIEKPHQAQEVPNEGMTPTARTDVPFLVTHWLAHYQDSFGSTEGRTTEERAAIRRIHHAAADLSTAFHALGSFGTTTRPLLRDDGARPFGESSVASVPATYSDRRRQWSHRCPPQALEHLVASAATTEQVVGVARGPVNLIQSSLEARARSLVQPSTGRTLQDAIHASTSIEETEEDSRPLLSSAFERPLILAKEREDDAKDEKKPGTGLVLASKFDQSQKDSADATRRYINLRNEHHSLDQQMQGLRRSLILQEKCLADLVQQRDSILSQNGSMDSLTKQTSLDDITETEQNAERVIAQLRRQLLLLQAKYAPLVSLLQSTKEESYAKYHDYQSLVGAYRDPFFAVTSNRTLVQTLISRASGSGMFALARGVKNRIPQQIEGMRKNITMRRLSYAATINTHLAYPIYCLRFDRTGRYFITGADDYLSRVFCLGSHVRANSGSSLDPQSYHRGAVLVCTLRGHAGVINDIAVSPDNAFLATASEDGDCRVWGLRDGSPIAILRGHTGGANMVSWSMLTPYRLVTAGADGYAKCWDIREACLIRYGNVIGKRFEYKRRKGEDRTGQPESERPEEGVGSGLALPPIPARPVVAAADPNPAISNTGNTESVTQPIPPEAPSVPVPLPPLPVGAQPIQQQEPVPPAPPEEEEVGRFVAGNDIDEGVKLLSRMQHGTTVDEGLRGHGTRSRHDAVKVLCVDVCPRGEYIATGADDGICRIFSANDDATLEDIDLKMLNKVAAVDAGPGTLSLSNRTSRRFHTENGEKVLVTLKGHLTAITDLKYSCSGDRLLSASQRDGVVRIWFLAGESIAGNHSVNSPSSYSGSNSGQVFHILIKLTNPEKATSTELLSRSNRQRPSRSSSAPAISCDVAAWLKDDSKIVTSQCELVKQSTSDIQPGSQYIFVWDSFTGQCLLGIRGAHTMQCPVVLPHPMLVSILCSAGADGIVKVWDLDSGECLLEHKNTVDFGPVEARDRGMISGYLDGCFSPDGTEVVLTDDCGRLTVLDCIESAKSQSYPDWMREQYFANDYYELCYDRHGYCVERGSEQPPHLAPRGVRCSYSGAPRSEQVNFSFKGFVGPLPDPQKEALWSRMRHRQLSRFPQKKLLKRSVVSQYDPETTSMIGLELEQAKQIHVETQEAERERAANTPRLSSNWRWRDYSDILQEEGQGDDEDPDPDDGSYELNESGNRRNLQDEDEDEDSDLVGYSEQETPVRNSRRQAGSESQPFRSARSRRQSNPTRHYDDDSDDLELEEFMSSNNTPSGPFRADYETHLFRVPTGVDSIRRDWLRRIESTSAYLGRKSYCPQVDDVVVYVPRAHFQFISEYPASPPWQNWPDGVEWPVVRCKVRSVRYRFPHRDFFSRNKSVVAILTLEINGIPELSRDRELPWPKPAFVDLPRRHIFEVSMFEASEPDFVIPIRLYVARLLDLEKIIQEDDNAPIRVQAFYAQSEDDSDLLPYEGILKGWGEENLDIRDANLLGSGYRCLRVSWEEDPGEDDLSPWEIAVQGPAGTQDIPRPQLSDSEKLQVRDALTQIRSIHDVELYLVHPVDTSRYTDYESRVENPMWLDFVRNRFEAGYYASRLSVIYDVKLIRENSFKYNGDDELTETASKMYDKFCELVLTEEELIEFREFEKYLEANALQAATHQDGADVETSVAATETGGVIRRSRRRVQNRSSLESLPAPGSGSGSRRPQRRRSFSSTQLQPRRRSSGRNISILEHNAPSLSRGTRARGTRGATGMEASANVAPVAPVVPLNSRNRGRTVRNSRGQRPNMRQSIQRTDSLAASQAEGANNRAMRARSRAARSGHSLRSGRATSLPSYADPAEDEDMAESEIEEINTSPRASRRSARAPHRDSSGSPDARNNSRRRRTRTSLAAAENPISGPVSDSPRRSSRTTDGNGELDSDGSGLETNTRSQRIRIRVASSQLPPVSAQSSRTSTRRVSTPNSNDPEEEKSVSTSRNARLSSRLRSGLSDDSDADQGMSSEESEAQDLNESEEEEEVTRPTRKRARSSPSRRTSRARGRTLYADPSSSEFDSDEAHDDDDSDDSEKGRSGRNARHRNAGKSPARKKSSKKPPKKKAMRKSSRPNPSPWVDIPQSNIILVGQGILSRLAIEDEEDIFALPVVESLPEIAEEYYETISEPMDFRTIRLERLGQYQSIRELQNDLITVFHNCIVFNGANTKYGRLAKSMLDVLDEIFHNVSEEVDVSPPSTRSSRRR